MVRHLMLGLATVLSISAHAQSAATPRPEAVVTEPNQNPVSSEIDYDIGSISPGDGLGYQLSQHGPDQAIWGFSFSNVGANAIIPDPAQIGEGPERDFDFVFDGRSRQNISMQVTDVPDDRLSNLMESYLYLFPRKNLPAIQWDNPSDQNQFTVVLPTGESVLFDKASKTIVGGVMKETRAIDRNPNRFARKFAGLEYTGTGVLIRVDKRGNDPRLNNTATITQGSKKCTLPTSLLFDQNESSAVEFLFLNDEDLNRLLTQKCHISFL